ncbi:MAG: hypothetical protein KC619_16575 [Myxococcales bacterium]|nr:hypothetical protein [Myxococcales bacterium]
MARRWYRWARDLDDSTFASALVGASLTAPRGGSPDVEIAKALDPIVPPLLARLPLPGAPWRHRLPPKDVAAVFDAAWSARPVPPPRYQRHGTTLAIPAKRVDHPKATLEWLDAIDRLLVHHVTETTVLDGPAEGRPSWSWPLRIGWLSPRGGLGPLGRLRDHEWRGTLFRLARAGGGRGRFDLMVVDASGAEALPLLERSRGHATALVLLGERTRRLRGELALLRSAQILGAAELVARQPRPGDVAEWLVRLVEELSHARPLHAALASIAEERPLLLGDRADLHRLCLIEAMDRELERMHELLHARPRMVPEVRIPKRLQDDLGLAPTTTAAELHHAMKGAAFGFEHEGGSATTIGHAANVMSATRRMMVAAGDEEAFDAGAAPGPRFFRARLRDGDTTIEKGPLPPRRDLAIEAGIGFASAEWLRLEHALPPPDAPKDDPDLGWRLRVVAWEPTVLPTPVARELWLPEVGETKPVAFPFRTGATPSPFGARLTLLHGNRILQTGLLTIADGAPAFRVDAAPTASFEAIDPDSWFGASFVLNDDVLGLPRVLAQSDDVLGVASLPETPFEEFRDAVSKALKQIADDPAGFTSVDDDATVGLLRDLAIPGAALRRALVKGTAIDAERLRTADRIQIVQARALTFFPAEFLYDYPTPLDDAELCPGAKAALASEHGKCTETHDEDHVCPTGFWSLSKVIERHAQNPADASLPGPFWLVAEPKVDGPLETAPLRQVLFAASDVADEVDPDSTRSIEEAVARLVGPPPPNGHPRVVRVDDWKKWKAQVGADSPSLLLLVPHHHGDDELQIGADSDRRPSQLTEDYVRGKGALEAPIVLVIGCKTLISRKAFDSIVENLHWSGAGVVVSTYATILGRHAAPATIRLLETLAALLDGGAPVRMGDVLFTIRRTLLLEGKPMALGLTAYGDADFRLVSA